MAPSLATSPETRFLLIDDEEEAEVDPGSANWGGDFDDRERVLNNVHACLLADVDRRFAELSSAVFTVAPVAPARPGGSSEQRICISGPLSSSTWQPTCESDCEAEFCPPPRDLSELVVPSPRTSASAPLEDGRASEYDVTGPIASISKFGLPASLHPSDAPAPKQEGSKDTCTQPDAKRNSGTRFDSVIDEIEGGSSMTCSKQQRNSVTRFDPKVSEIEAVAGPQISFQKPARSLRGMIADSIAIPPRSLSRRSCPQVAALMVEDELMDRRKRATRISNQAPDHREYVQAKAKALEAQSSRFELDGLEDSREVMKAGCLIRCMGSTWFEVVVFFLIVSNAVFLGVELQWKAAHLDRQPPTVFLVLHQTYAMVLAIELGLRVAAYGPLQMFWHRRQDSMWAWLDLFIVCSALIETAAEWVVIASRASLESEGVHNNHNVTQARVMKLLRVSKFVRSLRVQKLVFLIAPLRTLLFSIWATLRSLVWALMILMLLIYCAGIIITEIALDVLKDNPDPTSPTAMYWGDLFATMLTLFQSIIGGVSWREPQMVLAAFSPMASGVLLIFLGFVHLAVLNVVTGVFCSVAVDAAQRNPEVVAGAMLDMRNDYQAHLRALFGEFDADGTGMITIDEMEMLLADPMMHAHLVAMEIDVSDAWTLFRLIDKDGSGALDIEEFINGCESLKGDAKGIDLAMLSQEFKILSSSLTKFMRRCDRSSVFSAAVSKSLNGDDPRRWGSGVFRDLSRS